VSDEGVVEVEDPLFSALVGTILTGVVLCTVTGNVMVLLAVFVNSHLRSTTNYFIVNLAIADLLLGTTVLPFSASLEVHKVSIRFHMHPFIKVSAWSSYHRTWFSGPDKQEMLIFD
jgi:hypothetical protein